MEQVFVFVYAAGTKLECLVSRGTMGLGRGTRIWVRVLGRQRGCAGAQGICMLVKVKMSRACLHQRPAASASLRGGEDLAGCAGVVYESGAWVLLKMVPFLWQSV